MPRASTPAGLALLLVILVVSPALSHAQAGRTTGCDSIPPAGGACGGRHAISHRTAGARARVPSTVEQAPIP